MRTWSEGAARDWSVAQVAKIQLVRAMLALLVLILLAADGLRCCDQNTDPELAR